MNCPRCGTPMEGGICPECGFPVNRIFRGKRIVRKKPSKRIDLSKKR